MKESAPQYQVLLFYKYVHLVDPQTIMEEQKKLCEKLHLKGRIIVAKEGINGTVEGTLEETNRYIQVMEKQKEFNQINYKKSIGDGFAFKKLSVKVRPEIVSSGLLDLDPNKHTGKYLTADELHQWYQEGREFYLVDMRNDYEYISGYFENTIFSDFKNFRDIPSILPKLEHLKGKTIVTVCTGGVRCEKASGFLVTNGFSDVYQLENGIQTYMEKYPNQYFKGKLYVFDNRITVGFNTDSENHEIVGHCKLCGVLCDSYVNCMNLTCHEHFICCDDCLDKATNLAFCSEECKSIAFAKGV